MPDKGTVRAQPVDGSTSRPWCNASCDTWGSRPRFRKPGQHARRRPTLRPTSFSPTTPPDSSCL